MRSEKKLFQKTNFNASCMILAGAGSSDLSGNGIADDCVRNSEVSPVEPVEHLPAEVQPQLFVDLEVPMNSQIDVETAGAYKNSASRIPKTKLGRACKGRNTEPAVNGSIVVRQIAIPRNGSGDLHLRRRSWKLAQPPLE